MFKFWIAVVSAAMAAAVAVCGPSEARTRKHEPPAARSDVIVVHPRSFLDSGTVVSPGSLTPYIEDMTRFYVPDYGRYSPGVLGRPDPTFDPFSPGYPFSF